MPHLSYDALRDLTLRLVAAMGAPPGEAPLIADALAGANLVAPFGGSAGRLATNPTSIASPGPEGPLLLDITTSVVAEGKVRLKRNAGAPAPEGWLINHRGEPTTDPADLYTEPRGAILPLRGSVGHKGYGLAGL